MLLYKMDQDFLDRQYILYAREVLLFFLLAAILRLQDYWKTVLLYVPEVVTRYV